MFACLASVVLSVSPSNPNPKFSVTKVVYLFEVQNLISVYYAYLSSAAGALSSPFCSSTIFLFLTMGNKIQCA